MTSLRMSAWEASVYMDAGDLMLGVGEAETLLVTSCYRTMG